MSNNYETQHAIREANKIDLEDAYFNARPQFDFNVNRNIFGAGFDRAWNRQEERTAELRQQLADIQAKHAVACDTIARQRRDMDPIVAECLALHRLDEGRVKEMTKLEQQRDELLQRIRDWQDSTSTATDQLIAKSVLKALLDEREALQMRYDAAHSELARMTDQLGECRNVANDLSKQRDKAIATAKNANADADMYANAWQREICAYDGKMRNKTHHIDAMVVSTRDIVARLKKAEQQRNELLAEVAALRHHLTELAKFADRAALVLVTVEAEDTTESESLQEIINGIQTWAPDAMRGQITINNERTGK